MKKPQKGPNIDKIIEAIAVNDRTKLIRIFTGSDLEDHKNRYLHWEDLRFKKAPEGLTHEECVN